MSFLDNFKFKMFGEESKPKMVFLHGLMGYGKNWRSVIRDFEEDYNILVYDQRGHGKSIKTNSSYYPEDFSQDLFEILKELNWDNVILIGHSMGARNSHNFAHRFPEKLKLLVLEDLGPEVDEKAVADHKQLIEKVGAPFPDKAAAKEHIFKVIEDNVLANYLYANIEKKEDGSADWIFDKEAILKSSSQGREKSRWHEIEQLKVPTLLIRGEDSDALSPEVYENMLKANSLIEGVVIPNARHWVHYDNRQAFVRAIQKFLTKNS